ncbi:MAG TPA: UDP-N-acetylmuramate dehydrogenase [Limnochordales bacterium]|nr:UDP-N-acetylmuramate dehydrogenase [Limnochordales bacterium]
MKAWAKTLARRLKGEVRWHEPLRRHTSFRIGGPADLFVVPRSVEDVAAVQELAARAGIPVTVIGGGSNLLVADEGVRGVVMRIGRGLDRVVWDGPRVMVEAGAPLPRLAKEAAQRGFSGLEFAGGIPGTVGGALVMNAGAHDGCMAYVVRRVLAVGAAGDLVELDGEEMEFTYRSSRLQREQGLVAVQAELVLAPGDPEEVRAKMRAYLERRRRTQPLGTKNAGSIFKNPPGDFAGRLLELAGCKGMAVGDAVVSPLHANFIINRGAATAADVRRLIDRMRSRVQQEFGVELELEVGLLGFA